MSKSASNFLARDMAPVLSYTCIDIRKRILEHIIVHRTRSEYRSFYSVLCAVYFDVRGRHCLNQQKVDVYELQDSEDLETLDSVGVVHTTREALKK